MDPIQDYMNRNTRNSTPSAKFKKIGDKVVGTVVSAAIVPTVDRASQKTVENLVVELEIEHGVEDGVAIDSGVHRSVWFKPGEILRRLADAMKEANVASVIVGDKLAVDYYAQEPTKNLSAKKLYRVAYRVVNPSNSSSVTAEELV